MKPDKLIEPVGFIVAAVTAAFSLILFYSQTQSFFGSLFAALIAAGLAWITYVIMRLLILAFRR